MRFFLVIILLLITKAEAYQRELRYQPNAEQVKQMQEKMRILDEERAARILRRNTILAENKKLLEILKNDLDSFKGIEVLVAASFDGRPESMYGHGLLRFVHKNSKEKDIIVSPSALIEDGQISAVKGMLGQYILLPEVFSLVDLIIKYQRFENRPIQRFVIPTSSNQRRKLVEFFINMIDMPEVHGSYQFLNNNCWSAVRRALKFADVPLYEVRPSNKIPNAADISNVHIPIEAATHIYLNLMSIYPITTINSMGTVLAELKVVLGRDVILNKEGQIDFSKWSDSDIQKLSLIKPKTLYIIYSNTIYLPMSAMEVMIPILKNNPLDTSDIYALYEGRQIPDIFYDTCSDEECLSVMRDELRKVTYARRNLSLLEMAYHRLVRIHRNACSRLSVSKRVGPYFYHPQLQTHYHLLEEILGVTPKTCESLKY